MRDSKTSVLMDSPYAAIPDASKSVIEGEAAISTPNGVEKLPWSGLRAALACGFSEDFMVNGRDQPSIDQ